MTVISEAQASRDHQQTDKLRVQAILWNVLGPGSIANAIMELMDNLPADAVERQLWCLRADLASYRDYYRPAMPRLLYRTFCKAGIPFSAQGCMGNNVALRHIKPGDIIYAWPPIEISFVKKAQASGAIVIAERTTCMGAMAGPAIARAYARTCRPLPSEWYRWYTSDAIERENRLMLQCDFVTAANPLVSESLRQVGVPQERIIETSYGYSPTRLRSAIDLPRPKRAPVFAFVGAGIIGKGLDVLLESWEQAKINGELLIAGRLDSELQYSYKRILARSDIQALGYVEDIASVYAAADVFVFPTHAEGGPQVTYEAAACGLPSIVSPMGGGRIVRDGIEGIMIDPLDVDDLAGAIVRMAEKRDLRAELASNSVKRAQEFTWSKVGLRLYEQFRSVARQ